MYAHTNTRKNRFRTCAEKFEIKKPCANTECFEHLPTHSLFTSRFALVGQCCIDYLKCNKQKNCVTTRKCFSIRTVTSFVLHPTFDIMLLLACVSFSCYEHFLFIFLCTNFHLSFSLSNLPCWGQRHWSTTYSLMPCGRAVPFFWLFHYRSMDL